MASQSPAKTLHCKELTHLTTPRRVPARSTTGRGLLLAAAGVVAACHQDRVTVPESASFAMEVVGGDLQHAPAGSVLPQAFAVKVTDVAGAPVKSAAVVFRVTRGAATGSRMLDSVALTGADGIATAQLQLGLAIDTSVVTAFPLPAASRTVTMKAVATPAPVIVSAPTAIASGDTIALRGTGLSIAGFGGFIDFGGTRASALAVLGDTTLRVVVPPCLAPGDVALSVAYGTIRSNAVSSRYTSSARVVSPAPYEAVTIAAAQLGTCLLLPSNATYLVVAQFASTGRADSLLKWRLGSANAAAEAVPGANTLDAMAIPHRFEGMLRATEHAIAPAVRASAMAAPGLAMQGTSAPAPDTLRTFHVVSDLTGTAFKDVTARLRYAGSHVDFYVDVTGAGFTDEQYQGLGRLFDNDLYGIDASAFGAESDIDHNGRVVALFTPVVNAMVPAAECSSQGFVTGFFYGPDLLPTFEHSNRGEIFYSFIPDSTAIYSCSHTAEYVQRVLPATFIHELQHLISYSQHVVTRGGKEEETWLNEGLSHVAEELGAQYYVKRYPWPSGRLSIDQLYPDSAGPFITNDLLNGFLYLNNPRGASGTSYVAEGSALERGATWLFLHWLGVQKGPDIYRRLVQTSKTGIANLEAQTGERFPVLFGDFGIGVYADSLVGIPRTAIPPRYQFGDIALRKLMERIGFISGFTVSWPLPLFDLKPGGALSASMPRGTFSHAISRARTTSPLFSLQFTRDDLTPFTGTEGAQVSILRLPP